MIKPIIEGAKRRYALAVAEVAHQDLRQRAALGLAAVASSAGHVEEVLDEVERFVWANPDVVVLRAERSWLEGSS